MRNLIAILALLIAAVPAFGQDGLRIAMKTLEPFVIIDGGEYAGFSVDLWDEIAFRNGLSYEIFEVETVTDQLDAVRNGDADVAIAGISITLEREETLDFSFPVYDAGLQIMTLRENHSSILAATLSIFQLDFLRVIAGFLVVLLIAANIIWLAERQGNDDEFPREYWPGIWEALWWAAVTVTTVGYGDKAPRTAIGRIFGLVWMVGGLFLIAFFTAQVTATFTLNELRGTINDVSDLPGKSVVTIRGSTAADYLNDLQISAFEVTDIDTAYTLLLDERYQAIVFDAPVLQYYAVTEGAGRVEVVGSPFAQESYGIALPEGSDLREAVNQSVLEIIEDGTYARIHQRWFGTAPQ